MIRWFCVASVFSGAACLGEELDRLTSTVTLPTEAEGDMCWDRLQESSNMVLAELFLPQLATKTQIEPMLISGSGAHVPHWTAPRRLTRAEEPLLAGHNAMALLQWDPSHLHPFKWDSSFLQILTPTSGQPRVLVLCYVGKTWSFLSYDQRKTTTSTSRIAWMTWKN